MRIPVRIAAALLALACSLPGAAQQINGYWRAASNNAAEITGDISLSKNKLTMYFVRFPFVQARTLKPAEISSVFDVALNAGGQGALYSLHVPAEQRFFGRNTLCGTEETQWMAAYSSGNTLWVAFFSGERPPVFTIDAIANSVDVCGRFVYVR